jgi:plasmid stability protein
MCDIIIRLNDGAAARLSARAEVSGRSLEDEARVVLEEASAQASAQASASAAPDLREQRAFIKRLKRLRQDFFNDHLAPGAVARFLDAHKADPKPQRRRRAVSLV